MQRGVRLGLAQEFTPHGLCCGPCAPRHGDLTAQPSDSSSLQPASPRHSPHRRAAASRVLGPSPRLSPSTLTAPRLRLGTPPPEGGSGGRKGLPTTPPQDFQ